MPAHHLVETAFQQADEALRSAVREGFSVNSRLRAELDELARLNCAQSRAADYGCEALTAWQVKRAQQLHQRLIKASRQLGWSALAFQLEQAPGLFARLPWLLVGLSLLIAAVLLSSQLGVPFSFVQPAHAPYAVIGLAVLFLQVPALAGALLHKTQTSHAPVMCFYLMLGVSVVLIALCLVQGNAYRLAGYIALVLTGNVLLYGAGCLAHLSATQPELFAETDFNDLFEESLFNDLDLALAGVEPYRSNIGL